MANSTNIAELIDRMPALDKATEEKDKDGKLRKNTRDEAKLTGPKWEDAAKVYEQVLEGGRDAVVALIGVLSEGNKPQDYKARYLLHGLALHVCRTRNQPQRAMLAQAMVSQLGGNVPKSIQGFLVRELETVGTAEAVPALGKLLLDEQLGDDATRTLLSIGTGAAEQLRQALPNAQGRRRLVIIQALGVLGDKASAGALRQAAGGADADVRLAAVSGLAKMGDAGSVDIVLKVADGQGWERTKATQACLVLAEKLLAAGNREGVVKIYTHLQRTRTDENEKYICDLVKAAMDEL